MGDTITNNNADMFGTPGQVLRLKREEMGLSALEIAKQIHLDVKIIQSIEDDSSEDMPSAIYVRGYLRSYAKIVGADADKIIELYNADSPPPAPEILPEVKPLSQVSSNDKPVKAVTYLITLGLVLLLLIWYQSNFVVETKTNPVQTNTLTSINGVDVTYDVVNHPDSWQSPVSNTEEDAETTETLEPSEQNTLLELQNFNEEQTIDTLSLETDNNDSSLSSTGSGPDTIDIKLINDSWVEIYDSKNNRLFHDLALAGKQYKLKGTAPLNVILGFSKGVNIKFNGRPFDTEPHSKNGVARFTLSE